MARMIGCLGGSSEVVKMDGNEDGWLWIGWKKMGSYVDGLVAGDRMIPCTTIVKGEGQPRVYRLGIKYDTLYSYLSRWL